MGGDDDDDDDDDGAGACWRNVQYPLLDIRCMQQHMRGWNGLHGQNGDMCALHQVIRSSL